MVTSISRKAPLEVKASSGIGKNRKFIGFFGSNLGWAHLSEKMVSNSLCLSTEFRLTEEVVV